MTNTKLLEEYIDSSGYKRSYIASRLGITRYTLTKKINNVTEFLPSEIYVLCELLNIKDPKLRDLIFFNQNVGKTGTDDAILNK